MQEANLLLNATKWSPVGSCSTWLDTFMARTTLQSKSCCCCCCCCCWLWRDVEIDVVATILGRTREREKMLCSIRLLLLRLLQSILRDPRVFVCSTKTLNKRRLHFLVVISLKPSIDSFLFRWNYILPLISPPRRRMIAIRTASFNSNICLKYTKCGVAIFLSRHENEINCFAKNVSPLI